MSSSMSSGTAYDAIVIGLGGMGSAAAYRLVQRGKRVLGLEKFTPADALGSSHGGSRITRQAYFEDAAYVPLLLRAHEMWDQIEGDSVGAPGGRTITGSRASAEQFGIGHELLDAQQIRERFPTMRPAPDEVALYEPGAGFVVPETAVRAHLDLAARAGAELHFEEPVTHWEAGRVTTAEATYEAGHVVVCSGPWTPELLRHPTTTTSPWRAASRGTASRSCPSSARSWPTSLFDGATRHPIALFDPARLRGQA